MSTDAGDTPSSDPSSQLQQRIGNLEAFISQMQQQISSLQAQSSPPVLTAYEKYQQQFPTSASGSASWQLVTTPQVLYNGVIGNTSPTWTTLPLSAFVASGTTRVRLNGYARQSSKGDNQDQELNFRISASDPLTWHVVKLRSVNGTYTNEQGFTIEMPVNSDLSIQYQTLSGGFDILFIQILEYFA